MFLESLQRSQKEPPGGATEGYLPRTKEPSSPVSRIYKGGVTALFRLYLSQNMYSIDADL